MRRLIVLVVLAGLAVACVGSARTAAPTPTSFVAADITLHAAVAQPAERDTSRAVELIRNRFDLAEILRYAVTTTPDAITVSIGEGVDIQTAQLFVQAPGVFEVRALDADAPTPAVGDRYEAGLVILDEATIESVSTGEDQATDISIEATPISSAALAATIHQLVPTRVLVATLDGRVLITGQVQDIVQPGGFHIVVPTSRLWLPMVALSSIVVNKPLPESWRQP